MLAGVIFAALAPAVLLALGAEGQGYPAFGLLLGGLAVLTAVLSYRIWQRPVVMGECFSLSGLAHAGALRILVLALVNILPVAITSTLFLFFVEDRLQLPGRAGGCWCCSSSVQG
jgi:glycoside/pentoside/hexuronide:cation symporter, GPH family